jgi:hypothetical protein
MDQLSLFGDDGQKPHRNAENAKEETLLSSVAKVRELAREYFPNLLETHQPRRRRRPVTRKQRVRAARLGLVAKWSKEFGFISLHDPSSGDWVDVPVSEAPGWSRWEARKRKELYKTGDRHAYELTSKHMQQIWFDERDEAEEGIQEEDPIEEGR